MNGFRKMISDNIPKMWDLALRWCNCRTAWIEYVYVNHIAPYNNDWRDAKTVKELKAKQVRIFTSPKNVKFFDTINHDYLLLHDTEAYASWFKIAGWVTWFEQQYTFIASSAKIQMECKGTSPDKTAEYISKCYGTSIKLSKYIIDSINDKSS